MPARSTLRKIADHIDTIVDVGTDTAQSPSRRTVRLHDSEALTGTLARATRRSPVYGQAAGRSSVSTQNFSAVRLPAKP